LIDKGTELDPFSENFNVKAWTRKIVGVTSRDPQLHPKRTAGVAFRNLQVHGFGSDTGFQQTVGNAPYAGFGTIRELVGGKKRKVDILKGFDAVLDAGDMLVVLGPPGSGCSTLLKTIAGETHGLEVEEGSYINYQGISPKTMTKNFRGEAIYTAEQDVHFPALTVGDTLAFAAEARSHKHPPAGLTRREFAQHTRDVVMSILGIAHTVNTKVGNEYVRGVSGGERKRVSIAEALLSASPLQCWDNSTRGLDAANAVEFCKTLKTSTEYAGSTACVAIYQSPQAAYDFFTKVIVLYDGYQIYFGPATEAKKFFVDMGFDCPEQQSTPDFLTSLTSAKERRPRKGFEDQVPRSAEEFYQRWKASETYKELQVKLDEYDQQYPFGGEQYEQFLASRRAQQSKNTRAKSPYTLSYGEQVKLCLRRGFWRLKADPSLTLSQLFGNIAMGLIVSSVFYNLPMDTSSFYSRGALLFFAILLNAFGSALEILTLYAQRPIVEKHERYAFYHPSAEAVASMLTDMPYKIVNAIFFNLIIYFMTNLRREPGPFFFFFLVSFTATLTMSMFFRSLAALSRSLVQALTPAAGLILALVLYTGFALPPN
jgi:ABC-type multidrug transport system ATPase subunit